MQRTYQETECERCHHIVRRQQREPFIPPAWREVRFGYHGQDGGFVSEMIRLLCERCMAGLKSFLDGELLSAELVGTGQAEPGSLITEAEDLRRHGLVK